MNGCPHCLGRGRIIYGADTETGRLSAPCFHPIPLQESEEEKIFYLAGLEVYFSMIRNHPRQAFTCIGGAVLILLIMFGLIFLAGLGADPLATINEQPTLAAAAKAMLK